jgi:hypothetical protein
MFLSHKRIDEIVEWIRLHDFEFRDEYGLLYRADFLLNEAGKVDGIRYEVRPVEGGIS